MKVVYILTCDVLLIIYICSKTIVLTLPIRCSCVCLGGYALVFDVQACR